MFDNRLIKYRCEDSRKVSIAANMSSTDNPAAVNTSGPTMRVGLRTNGKALIVFISLIVVTTLLV